MAKGSNVPPEFFMSNGPVQSTQASGLRLDIRSEAFSHIVETPFTSFSRNTKVSPECECPKAYFPVNDSFLSRCYRHAGYKVEFNRRDLADRLPQLAWKSAVFMAEV